MNRYLLFTLLALFAQGFFAFFEMACVSFNKVRLQYYVSLRSKRALWLNYLLQRPSRLFGTTLVGITTSLVIGSECSRLFYGSIGLDPDLAPLTQVPLVVIFAELAPLFAARRHPEQAAMTLVPIMILLARILMPITWTFDAISRLVHRLMKKDLETPLFLSREEVRAAFEEFEGSEDEFQLVCTQIFKIKNLNAGELMVPLAESELVPSHATLSEVRHLLSVHYAPMVPIYHKQIHNIVAVAEIRDLLRLSEQQRVLDAAKSPWFVTKETSIVQLLQQFRHNNQSLAVILDPSGQGIGVLTLDQILAEIFGEEAHVKGDKSAHNYIDRTLSGDMEVEDFNQQFLTKLPEDEGSTLSDLIVHRLGHFPVIEERLRIQDLEFTVIEPTIRGVKSFLVRTVRD